MLMASTVLPEHELYELLKPAAATILAAKEGVQPHKNLFAGALHAFADNIRREAVFKSAAKGLSEEDTVKLLVLAPYRNGTWFCRRFERRGVSVSTGRLSRAGLDT